MVDDKYWQLLKRSLADQHRQYLEEVTEPMSLGFDAPEEFVTTKPSIYHSLRMQPATDAKTGKVRSKPAIARALANIENLEFQNALKNYSLPLSTNQGESLYGRHVYPSELYSFNPNFNSAATPDLPTTYKRSHGAGDLYRQLNLYGFANDAPIPQRFTDKTLQPEGILYGDLDENDVVQLNTNSFSVPRISQVARALSPFHPERDVNDLGEVSGQLASNIMEAGIPPILAESNVDTTGKTHALPFRIDEVSDVKEAHDPFAQWRPDSLMTSSPEGLEQFTREGEHTFPVSSLRTGKIMDVAEQKNASEPMEIAMQLLKASLPTMREAGLSFEDLDALRFIPNYRKTSFYQPQLLNKPANIDWEKRTASQKPEYKKIPGLQTELGPPQNNIHSYFVNPATRLGALAGDVTFMAEPTLLGIRNNDKDYGVDFWRTERQGAGSEGGEGLIYGELPKQNFAEIPINYHSAEAMRAKLNLDHFMNTFGIPEEEAFEMLATRFPEVHNIASQFPNVSTQDTSWQQPAQYRGTNPLLLDEIDTKVASEPMDIVMQLLKEEVPYSSRDYPPQEIAVSTGTPLMGSKNSGPTPEVCNIPGCESGLPPVIYRRMANPIRSIDNHEFMCEQCAYKNDMQSLLYHKMLKGEITLTDYTMQILKNQFKLNEDFTSLRDEAHEGKKENWDGRGRWNEMKKPIYEEYGDEPMPGASWKKPFDLEGFDPKDKSKDFDESGAALPLHFYNQLKRIPMLNQPTAKRILQMALNTGQGMADGSVDKPYELSDFVDFNNIQTSEPMHLAMRLLKEEPLHLQGSNTLARRAREELETDMTGQNSPAYQEMMERMMDIYEPQDGSISLEDNLDQYSQETGKNPWRSLPGREMPNKHGGTAKVHLAPITPVHPQPFYDWQAKNASEPMEIAMQLLKNYDVEEVKRLRMGEGSFEDYIDHQIADAQPGMDRKLPRPFGLMSHKALNHLSHGWFEGDIREMLDDPNFAFERDDEGRAIWSPHNLGWGNPEHAHPEHMGFMIENQLEGTPVDFDEIRRESYLRELENTPWELNEPRTSKFLGLEMKPSSTTDFSSAWAYGPTDTLEQVEGQKNRGFQDIYTGEPMEIAMQLLKERVSPEAKRHKLEYDKKYESSPERVKYREELNRERRQRHIMGQGGPDMSHTKDHTIVPEDSQTNRARHFKDKGTLL